MTFSLSLTQDNVARTVQQIRTALVLKTLSRRQWESILGALNFAAPVTHFGWLCHCRLALMVNSSIPIKPRDPQRPVLRVAFSLLRPWVRKGALSRSILWMPPSLGLTVTTDESDMGWGYQLDVRHKAYEGWLKEMRGTHINLPELWVAKEWLQLHTSVQGTGVWFDMDNVVVVRFLQAQGTACSDVLLLPDEANLLPSKVDLFASRTTAQRTRVGGPDALTED